MRISPTPSQLRGRARRDPRRAAMLIMEPASARPCQVAAGRARIARAEARPLREARWRRSKGPTGPRSDRSTSAAILAVEQRRRHGVGRPTPSPTTIGTPRERASIATWLVGLPRNSASPPPPVQSISRKRDGGRSSAQTIAPPGIFSACLSSPRSMSHDAIAHVGEIGRRAPGNIRPVRTSRNPRSAASSAAPGRVGRLLPAPIVAKAGADEGLVLQHGDLEFEDLGGLASGSLGELGDLPRSPLPIASEGGASSPAAGRRSPASAGAVRMKGPRGKADRGRFCPGRPGRSSRACARALVEIAPQPARSARPPRLGVARRWP